MNRYWILTAAHCVDERVRVDVIVGEHNKHLHEGPEQWFLNVPKDNVHVHEFYNQPFRLRNDIALIRLKTPIIFNDNVQPVCPPQPAQNYIGRTIVVSGWGKDSNGKL